MVLGQLSLKLLVKSLELYLPGDKNFRNSCIGKEPLATVLGELRNTIGPKTFALEIVTSRLNKDRILSWISRVVP